MSPLRVAVERSSPTGGQGRQDKNRNDNDDNDDDDGCIGSSYPVVASPTSPFSSSSLSSSPSASVVVIVADGEANINPTEIGIETTLMECLDVVLFPDDHCKLNSNDSNEKGKVEEAEIPSLTLEGGTGARRAGEEKGRVGGSGSSGGG